MMVQAFGAFTGPTTALRENKMQVEAEMAWKRREKHSGGEYGDVDN